MSRRYWIVYGSKLQAYQATHNLTQSGRKLEASVLMQAANKIKECRDNWDAPDRDVKLNKVLVNNQRLWSILQAELIKDDNPLPRQIKEDILNLSIFIDKKILEVMAHPAPEKLKILIDINLNIAAGLSAKPAE
jgi:flagellar protein FlaF